ncbi:MAG: helix-turn-helix domain-containing protein [Deferrisomatales bacterium]|nr:helix-turn-helix domain-containing protein [Deferrisomatales bacterium]
MAEPRYTIDELVEITGVSRRNIRYYVQEGLLDPPAGRGRGGFYYDSHVERLRRIRELQDRGLRLATIREHLAGQEAREDPRVVEGQTAPRPPEAPGAPPLGQGPEAGSREAWARVTVVPGLELHVRRDVEEDLGAAVREILRLARALTAQGGSR